MSDPADRDIAGARVWRDYVALVRFPYHLSFVAVPLGALVVTRDWTAPLVRSIVLLYVSWNVLLYGGLYTLNAITDAEADRRHALKRKRPVASGAIPRSHAAAFAALLIVSGFVTGWMWLGTDVMPVYLLVVMLNVAYSFLFRNIAVLDVLFNSATHPPRFLLGMWLAGGSLEWDWLLLVFLFAIGISTCRRSISSATTPGSRVSCCGGIRSECCAA